MLHSGEPWPRAASEKPHLTPIHRTGQGTKPRIEPPQARSSVAPCEPLRFVAGGDAIAVAVGGIFHVVDGQDTPAGIVAALIDHVDGHAAAPLAFVCDQGVQEGPDIRQSEAGALRKQAEAVIIPVREVHAGDVFVVVVDCREVFVGRKDYLAEALGEGYRFGTGPPAHLRAAAVDAKGGGHDAKGSRDGEETGEADEEIHVSDSVDILLGPMLVEWSFCSFDSSFRAFSMKSLAIAFFLYPDGTNSRRIEPLPFIKPL